MNETITHLAPSIPSIEAGAPFHYEPVPEKASRVTLERNCLCIDGRARFLYAGDCCYGRIPRRCWRDRLLVMRNAGLNTVSFYCVWRLHEPQEGHWRWDGDYDLAAFIDLIGELGMYAIFRMGPFIHSEFRHGGYPDYMVERFGGRLRSNDGDYLRCARKWYDRLLAIARPRLIDTGGPIILLQLENELGSAGCKGDDIPRGSDSEEENRRHLEFYCRLVRDAGIGLPLIDINRIPGREELLGPSAATGGSYPACCFGSDGDLAPITPHADDGRPYITIETGSGMFLRFFDYPAYRNTNSYQGPVIRPELVEALAMQTMIEGANGVGLFIFCDGQNAGPDGESMLPECDMNFQAPVSCVGTLRESYRRLKRFGWFLRAFEAEVVRSRPDPDWARVTACGTSHPGENASGDLFDGYGRSENAEPASGAPVPALARVTTGLNLSDSNFLFIRNASNIHAPWRRDVRIAVTPNRLGCEVYHEFPQLVQMEVPPGNCKLLPFYLRLAPGYFLDHSTATPVDRRSDGGRTRVILHAGIDEFTETVIVTPAGVPVSHSPGLLVKALSPNQYAVVGSPSRGIEYASFGEVDLILVDSERAGDIWEAGGQVAFSDLYLTESERDGDRIRITATAGRGDFFLDLLSDRDASVSGAAIRAERRGDSGRFPRFTGTVEGMTPPALLFTRRSDGGDTLLEAEVTPGMLDGFADLILESHYDGKGARAYLDDRLISDHYYGRFLAWEVGLGGKLTAPSRLRLRFLDGRDIDCRVRVRKNIAFTVELKG